MKITNENFKIYLRICTVFALITVIGVFIVPGCLWAEGTRKPPDSNRMEPGYAPTPFSAAEIHAACPRGRTIVFQVETFEKPLLFQTLTFGTETSDGANFESVVTGADGKPIGKRQAGMATWTELQSHASFPEAQTVITSTKFTTSLGTFDCWLYTIKPEKGGKGSEKRYRFAKSMPGPPVCFDETLDGRVIYRMTMLKSEK
jgi:hypothetical protein